MRKFTLLMGLFLIVAAFVAVSARADGTLELNAQTTAGQLEFSGVQAHDVYEHFYVSETCYREVLDHYQTVCHDVRDEVCRTDTAGHRICTPIVRRECDERPVYRSESYECGHWERRHVGEETDFFVDARVDFAVTLPSEATEVRENIIFGVDRDSGAIQFRAGHTSKKFLLFVNFTQSATVTGPMKKTVIGTAIIKVVPAEAMVESFSRGIFDFTIDRDGLSFRTLKHEFSSQMGAKLELRRHRKFWFSKKLFKGQVSADALERVDEGKTVLTRIDFRKLNLRERLDGDEKLKLELKSFLLEDALSGCLNPRDLGTTSLTHLCRNCHP